MSLLLNRIVLDLPAQEGEASLDSYLKNRELQKTDNLQTKGINMNEEMGKWEKEQGVEFLRKIGIRTGQAILDFGARVGRYTIPAASIVGVKGIVYALDKNQEALTELKQKAKTLGLENIKIIKNSGEVKLDLESNLVDAVLLYDVLHFIKKDDRKILYQEVYRILKPNALLSVYPKHALEDNPLDEFQKLRVDDVKQEIQDSGFLFKEKYCDTISHDDSLNQGCVLNFRNVI